MDARGRRALLVEKLHASQRALTGGELATQLGVSRQVIVQDIALLRAQGHRIVATPGGYLFERAPTRTEIFACRHEQQEQLRQELYAIVDQGGRVVDVIVEHAIYGQLRAMLDLATRYDVDCFVQKLATTGAEPLSALTAGVHLHTVSVSDAQMAQRIRQALRAAGVLVEK